MNYNSQLSDMYKSNKNKIKRFLSLNLFIGLLAMTTSSFKSYDDKDRISIMTRPEGFKSHNENRISIITRPDEIDIDTLQTTLCPKALMRREWAAMETTIRIPQRTSQQPAALPLIIPAVKQPAALPPIIISPESKEYIRPERMEYVPLPSYLRTENPSHYAGTENKEKSFKDWLLSCLEKLSDYFNRNEDEDKDKNQTASTLTYETESRSSSLSENESDSESMFNCFINYFTSCCSGNEYEDENEDGDED